MGPVFPVRAQDDTGADPAAIARAYSIAREVFAVRDIWSQIEALDNRIPAAVQYTAMFQTTRLLRHMSYWLLENRRDDLDIKRAVSALCRQGGGAVPRTAGRSRRHAAGAHERAALATRRAAACPNQLAGESHPWRSCTARWTWSRSPWRRACAIGYAAQAYFDLGERIGLTWIKEQIEALTADGHWQAVARGTLRDNLYALQRRITLAVLELQGQRPGGARRSMAVASYRTGRGAEAAWWWTCGPARRRTSRRCPSRCKRSGASPRIDVKMLQPIEFGAKYLQGRIDREIVLAKHMGIVVEAADDDAAGAACTARAECEPQGHRIRRQPVFARGVDGLGLADARSCRAQIRCGRRGHPGIEHAFFDCPCTAKCVPASRFPPAAEVDKFHKMLSRAGRGRIRLRVQMRHGESVAAIFDGVFAAAMRREES